MNRLTLAFALAATGTSLTQPATPKTNEIFTDAEIAKAGGPAAAASAGAASEMPIPPTPPGPFQPTWDSLRDNYQPPQWFDDGKFGMNGVYMMNISPLPDGTIPQEQQDRLLAIGAWLDVNGEAIYGTRAWTKYGEGPYADAPPAPWVRPGPDDPAGEAWSSKEIRFTTMGDTLYAIVTDWPADGAVFVTSLATGSKSLPAGKIVKVEPLGYKAWPRFLGNQALAFKQDESGLHVKFPAAKPCDFAYALRITGLKPR